MESKITYKEALAEIEQIVANLEIDCQFWLKELLRLLSFVRIS